MDESRFSSNNPDLTPGNSGLGGTAEGSTTNQFGTTPGSTGLPGDGGIGIEHSAEESGAFSSNVVSMLEKFGVGESQLNAVREALKNANVEQSLEKAREQVNEAVTNARTFAKKNPGAVMAGIAVVVIGAGLIAGAALRRNTEKL
jgi:hypothetical protein